MKCNYQLRCIKEIKTGGSDVLIMRDIWGSEISRVAFDSPIRITPVGSIGHFTTKASVKNAIRSGHWEEINKPSLQYA